MNAVRDRYKLWLVFTAVIALEVFFWAIVAVTYFIVVPRTPTLDFHNANHWWLLLLLPVCTILYAVNVVRKNIAIGRFAQSNLVPFVFPQLSTVRSILKFILFRIGMACIVIALIGPMFGSKLEEVKSKGIDIMLALDVSNSMLAEDVEPNRLAHSKLAIEQLLSKLRGDRIGLVVFAGNAFVQMPITNDYDAARLFLENIDTKSVTMQGTAIGNAIRLCVESFDTKSPAQKVIVVITDGENHEDDAIDAAKTALVNHKILVHTIGVGTPDGTLIPLFNEEGKQTRYRVDENGNSVVTRLNEDALKEIAEAGSGTFTRMAGSLTALAKVVKKLDSIEKSELDKKEFADYEQRYGIFLAAGILLLVLEQILAERKGTWTSTLNFLE
ncbi:MAG: VWA domain-containing protein [Flavobacteriales bacterium]|nr:VWA domain-containing protein [Flavobacteriales bacterium]